MKLQHERDEGMIPQGHRVGSDSALGPIRCDHMLMGKPRKPSATFCPQSSIIILFLKLVEAINALDRARQDSMMA